MNENSSPIEMAIRVAAEYKEKDSQVDSGNLYAALCQCLDYIERLKADQVMASQRFRKVLEIATGQPLP